MAAHRRAYVYGLTHEGEILYVGKGTGDRLRRQKAAFKLEGHEIARFKDERSAYKRERQLIAELQPRLNMAPGGNGSYSAPARAPRSDVFDKLAARIGLRALSARIVFHCWRIGAQQMTVEDAYNMARVGYGSA